VKTPDTYEDAPGRWRGKTPDELLREVQAEEAASVRKGHLKIFLGYASGVGKSFRMFDEARRRRERGQDIIVGAVQPRVSPDVESLLNALEVVPLKTVGAGSAVDVEAILRRRPAVCVIDALAHDNPPGARHSARWQDVRELLDAGIKVITSVNVQYVAELRDRIREITGKDIRETVPGAFIKSADEIEILDAPAGEPAPRSPEEEAELRGREERFAKLREMALVIAADVVDFQLSQYLEAHGIQQRFGAQERILVCTTPRANVEEMLEEARIVADRFHGDLIVAYVKQPEISEVDRAALDSRLALASAAGAQIAILEGADPAGALLDYARSHGVTQLFVGHSQRGGLARLMGSPLDKLIWGGHGMDVRVFPH
jgi:two-component system, OmpR family, sensor histidine kinase KdpD